MAKGLHLPPGTGVDYDKALLYNPYQQAFMEARRRRFCLHCKTTGSTSTQGIFVCPGCGRKHIDNLTAPRVFNRFSLLAGRQSGKTLIAAWAAREEALVPNAKGWVMGPNYKILHDSTFPTFMRLIHPDWIQAWDREHMELTLKNGSITAFRSLEDPQRARGPQGVAWGWFDEAAQCPEAAYNVFEPTLTAALGIVIASTTVLGFDWTWNKLEKMAMDGEPGYWRTRWWTEENPLYKQHPQMMAEIERAKKTWDPDLYAQEYKAERRNAALQVYRYETLERQIIREKDIEQYIPEWRHGSTHGGYIDPSRRLLVGLDSGANHPFGAVLIVITEFGLVCVGEYLQRMQAISQQLIPIKTKFGLNRFADSNITWAANKNEANLRLEFGLKNISIYPAESKHEVGIQRVASWMHSGQLYFVKELVPNTIEQLKIYRYQDPLTTKGEKTEREKVYKLNDELCDGLRYALMAYPELPSINPPKRSPRMQERWEKMDERTKVDIERWQAHKEQLTEKNLSEKNSRYPIGEFWGNSDNDGQSVNIF